MIRQLLHCPDCQGSDIVKNGKTSQGKQRVLCREKHCDGRTFILDDSDAGQSSQVKQVIEMALNGSGIREPAIWHSTSTVIKELKKSSLKYSK